MVKLKDVVEKNLKYPDIRRISDPELIQEIQFRLGIEGDGRVGKDTIFYFFEFKEKKDLPSPYALNRETAQSLLNNVTELPEKILFLVNLAKEFNWDKRWIVYLLATIHHETNELYDTFVESGHLGSRAIAYRRQLPYYPFFSRGFVSQLTGENKYKLFSDLLGIDLVKDPDLALNPEIAGKILILGMEQGLFTGRKISEFIYGREKDYYGARRVFDGLNYAGKISNYALIWEGKLGI